MWSSRRKTHLRADKVLNTTIIVSNFNEWSVDLEVSYYSLHQTRTKRYWCKKRSRIQSQTNLCIRRGDGIDL